jgi:hypothetical protein
MVQLTSATIAQAFRPTKFSFISSKKICRALFHLEAAVLEHRTEEI